MNYAYLESSKQPDRFFPDSLYKIKSHIFKNISKYSKNGLISFRYNNTCELCGNILGKDKRGRIMARNVLFFTRKLWISFMTNFTLPQYKKLYFILIVSGFLVQYNAGRQEMIVSIIIHQKRI